MPPCAPLRRQGPAAVGRWPTTSRRARGPAVGPRYRPRTERRSGALRRRSGTMTRRMPRTRAPPVGAMCSVIAFASRRDCIGPCGFPLRCGATVQHHRHAPLCLWRRSRGTRISGSDVAEAADGHQFVLDWRTPLEAFCCVAGVAAVTWRTPRRRTLCFRAVSGIAVGRAREVMVDGPSRNALASARCLLFFGHLL